MEKKYNIWHIDAYAGFSDCDGPNDCNIHEDIIFDAKFSRSDIMSMLTGLYGENRVFEVWKCQKVDSDTI